MKCASCSAENPASAKFCHACGVPLVMQQAQTPPPGAQPKNAGMQISPTVIGIVLLLGISVVGAAYVGWTWYEDSSRADPVASLDEKMIEERRKKAEQDRLADERQKTQDAEREKRRQLADAEQAMKLAQGKANEEQRRAEDAARDAQEKAKRAEAKAREDARAAQEAKAQQDAKAQEAKAREAKAREEARARELARREAAAREAKARQQAQASTAAARPAETAAPAPTPAPAQPQPVPVAQAAPAPAPAQNDPCAGLSGLKREQCTSCNRHTFGPRKAACEDRAMERYCERRWNQPGQQECVDSRRR